MTMRAVPSLRFVSRSMHSTVPLLSASDKLKTVMTDLVWFVLAVSGRTLVVYLTFPAFISNLHLANLPLIVHVNTCCEPQSNGTVPLGTNGPNNSDKIISNNDSEVIKNQLSLSDYWFTY